jgi:hypothetical protein
MVRLASKLVAVVSLSACYQAGVEDSNTDTEAASSEDSGTAPAADDDAGPTGDDDDQTSMPPLDDGPDSTTDVDTGPGTTMGPVDESTGDDTTGGTSPGVVDGQYLFALQTTINPNLPLQWYATTDVDEAAGTFTLTLQSLSLDEGSTTTPRELVGEVLTYTDIPVDPIGFSFDLGTVMIVGAANPLTGSDIVATVMLQALPGGDPICGTVTGMVSSPLEYDLVGSTFATVPVASVDDLPLEFPASCP